MIVKSIKMKHAYRRAIASTLAVAMSLLASLSGMAINTMADQGGIGSEHAAGLHGAAADGVAAGGVAAEGTQANGAPGGGLAAGGAAGGMAGASRIMAMGEAGGPPEEAPAGGDQAGGPQGGSFDEEQAVGGPGEEQTVGEAGEPEPGEAVGSTDEEQPAVDLSGSEDDAGGPQGEPEPGGAPGSSDVDDNPDDAPTPEPGQEPGAGEGEDAGAGEGTGAGEGAGAAGEGAGSGAPASGSISGFLWADGDGSLPTDWDGLHNGGEQPLAGYAVYLYASGDQSGALAETLTGGDGKYIFNGLASGSYIVGLAPDTVGGTQYTLPLAMTPQSKFGLGKIGGILMALSAAIELGEGQSVNGIDAGMWISVAEALEEGGLGEESDEEMLPPMEAELDEGVELEMDEELDEDIELDEIDGEENAEELEEEIMMLMDAPMADPPKVIQLGTGAPVSGNYSSLGYKVAPYSGSYEGTRKLTFDQNANNNTYEIKLTGTKVIYSLVVPSGVDTTIIFSSIDDTTNSGYDSIKVESNGKLELLLLGYNNLRANFITVEENSELTIDSATTSGSEEGSLYISASSSERASIGGNKTSSGQITINGGTISVEQTAVGAATKNANAAAIGGGYGGSHGKSNGYVTINGGHVTAKIVNSDIALAGAAAIGGGASGFGRVEINGGTVVATAKSGGAAIGSGSAAHGSVTINDGNVFATSSGDGAAIGGGRSNSFAYYDNKPDVTIYGGYVNATSTGAGAGIGGGTSNNHLDTYKGEVVIHAGNVDATGYEGAAIGGGRNSVGKVTIYSGTINAIMSKDSVGAAIGGGGGKNNTTNSTMYNRANVGEVHIEGGDLKLKSYDGAGIGNGGNARGINYTKHINGNVYIKNATIYIEVEGLAAGVGTGKNTEFAPYTHIDHSADILAFMKVETTKGAIDAAGAVKGDMFDGQNHGDAFFVNGNSGGIDNVANEKEKFLVFENGSLSKPVKVVDIPFGIKAFGFTTGKNYEEVFNIYGGDAENAGLQKYVMKKEGKMALYSVNNALDYHNKNDIGYPFPDLIWYSLYLQYEAISKIHYYPVNEKYVDLSNNTIAGEKNDLIIVPKGDRYTESLYAADGYPARKIDGYKYMGYKWDNPPYTPKDFVPGSPNEVITKERTIYYVYKVDDGTSDLSVGMEILGDFADTTKLIWYTAQLTGFDRDGNPMAKGTKIRFERNRISGSMPGGPEYGELTMDENGVVVFYMRHNDKITLAIPETVKVVLTQTQEDEYITEYWANEYKSGASVKGHSATIDPMGYYDREYRFVNTRQAVVPTGIGGTGGRWGPGMAPLLGASATLLALAALAVIKRKMYR